MTLKKLLVVVNLRFLAFLLFPTIAMSQLHTDFYANPLTGCPPMVINFTDSSTGDPTSWRWDFGNGSFGTGKSAVATYLNPGTYNVKLVIRNGRGVDSLTKSQYIVVNALPAVDFAASATTGCFPLKVNFSDRSLPGSGTISAWEWDFGDGTVSFEQNPVHTYTIDGNFRVILKVTNSNGCVKVALKPGYIKLKNGVKSNFEFTSAAGCQIPSPVNFINKTIGTGNLAYQWDFGDGKTSQDINPVNYYQNAGVYTVKLITTNSYGCTDTLIKPSAINIGIVKADFSKPDVACPGSTFQLTNTSNPSSFTGSLWDFGDGTFSNEANPSKSYAAPGNYQVKLVTDFGSCKDSTIKAITILNKSVTDITAANNNSCNPPLNVSFNNSAGNSVSYTWLFGDGQTSNLQNPQHLYTTVGSYTVSLITTSASGCIDTTIKANFVNIIPPKIASINNLPVKGCIPYTITPVPVFQDSTLQVTSYLWDFGDGTTSTKANPKHTYTIPGAYTVKLTIISGGCTDSLVILNAVKVGTKPKVDFTADDRDVCASKTVKFTDRSTGGTITEWLWNFGDGSFSTEQNTGHMYRDTGFFRVYLVATNFGCSDTLRKNKYIYVRPPVAKFDTAFSCDTRLTRDFIDKSIGAKNLKWDLGNGITFTDKKKITHTFDAPGLYPVTLIAKNAGCTDTLKTNVIIIKEQGKLSANNPVSCINAPINFTVNNINPANIRSYTWYFNGITQPVAPDAINPVTTQFAASGNYPVTSVITDILGCRDTLYNSDSIKIYGSKANFFSSVAGACLGNTITFDDSTKTDGIHPVTKWLWNFGDSTTQAFTNPPFTHQYNKEGKFGVSLTVTDSYGCIDSIGKPDSINIIKPVAKFIQSDTLICPNTTITFTNQTNGLNNVYHWDFGDNSASDSISPLHTYTKEGKYQVKLVVSNLYGCGDSLISYINVVTTAAGFLMSDTFVNCPPLTVNFSNTSIGFSGLEWDFDDEAKSTLINPSHIYTEPGVYRIRLLAKNNTGCFDTTSRVLVVKGPKGTFSYSPLSVCTPGKIDFTANVQEAVKFLWNYQDGATDSTSENSSSHSYETSGLYLPKLIVEDSTGCRFVIPGKDTIVAKDLKTSILADKEIMCDSGLVHFSNNTLATEQTLSYKWSFGDSTTSSLTNPEHNFTQPGDYNVNLQVFAPSGCTDTTSVLIKVATTPAPAIIAPGAVCSIDSVTYSAQIVNDTAAITLWNWNFGNGNISSSQSPGPQYYTAPGNYTASLSVTNNSGCAASVTKPIVINGMPILKVSPDTDICTGGSVSLTASGASSYTWTPADNSLSCTDCNNPTASPTTDMVYSVKGTSAEGCSVADSVKIKVSEPFKVDVTLDSNAICSGKSMQLTAKGASNYIWSPSTGLSSSLVANPVAKPNVTTTYQVIGYDALACRNDTASVTITVYNNPKVDLGPDKTVLWRTSAVITPSVSNDIVKYTWVPSTGLSCSNCSTPGFMATNDMSYKLVVENEHCVAEDNINIIINYGDIKIMIPNAFSPNGDGINDVFYPTGVGAAFLKSFAIFNRWGTQIFGVSNVPGNDPAYGWNGTWKSKQAEVGVYYYIIEVLGDNDKITRYTGHITLLK